jgi:hypothetical protein
MELEVEVTPRLGDDFCILTKDSTKNFKLVLDNCRLFVKTVDIIDGLSLSFASTLLQKTAKYALKRTELKSMFISQGRREYNASLFSEQVPRRAVLGIVKHKDFTGATTDNPFNFINAGVQSIGLSANGLQFPNVPYFLDYDKNLYSRAYYHMLDNLGFSFTNSSNSISLEKFKNGWAFYVFNLTTSLEDEPGFDLLKSGTTTLSIRFDKEVPVGGYELIVYAEYDSVLMIDTNRVIASDLTA